MANRHGHITEFLSPYIDHQLSPEEQARVEAHLVSCAECRRELQQLQRLVALLRSCPQVKPPHSFALSPDMVRPQQGLVIRLARWAPAVTALAAVLLAALLFADIQMLSSRAALPAAQPSLQVLSTTVAPAPGAATLAPAATAPASMAVALPTPTASVASLPEAAATAEPEERPLAAPAAPAAEASAASAMSAAGGAGEMPTQTVEKALREDETLQPTAPQQKALATPEAEPSEAAATAPPAATPAAAIAQDGERGAEEAPAATHRVVPEPAVTMVPSSAQETPVVQVWPLRVAEGFLALILLSSLTLWLRRLFHSI